MPIYRQWTFQSLRDILVDELHAHLYLSSSGCESRWAVYTPNQQACEHGYAAPLYFTNIFSSSKGAIRERTFTSGIRQSFTTIANEPFHSLNSKSSSITT